MKVYCEIVRQGLAEQRRRDATDVATIIAAGVDENEAARRVYYPWKTAEQYQKMLADYEQGFGDS
jgi:hypothetical protein